VVHDRGRTTDREIIHHRFTEADVRAGKVVTPGSRLLGIVNKAG
jgi:multidrug resistance efflux pump